MNYSLSSLLQNDGFACSCGRRHYGLVKDCIIGENALQHLPELLGKYHSSHPFLLCDADTYAAAGKSVCALLDGAGVPYTLHIIKRKRPAPDERLVGEAVMFCDAACDAVVAIGGGVINDTGKLLAVARGFVDIYVATAPSMDGFASATSSMEREGLKVSLPAQCPDAIIGDAAILAAAPRHMILSGIGDMAAKYVSLAEWRMAELLVDEYHCPVVADIMRNALDTCMQQAAAAVQGDRDAVCRLTEGLVLAGMAMNYAGISRPASGMEHYISHILDMRGLEFGTPCELHGIQAGYGTLVTLQAYEKLADIVPDREKALAYAAAFDLEGWFDHLRGLLGHGAEAIIAGEYKERKYDKAKHAARLERILAHWDELVDMMRTMPRAAQLQGLFESIGFPTTCAQLGFAPDEVRQAFAAAKDIRDKYVLGRLLWDLGIECSEVLC